MAIGLLIQNLLGKMISYEKIITYVAQLDTKINVHTPGVRYSQPCDVLMHHIGTFSSSQSILEQTQEELRALGVPAPGGNRGRVSLTPIIAIKINSFVCSASLMSDSTRHKMGGRGIE